MNHSWTFAIDRGGTFTDVVARSSDGRLRVEKLLSENSGQYEDAALEAIRRVIEGEVIRDVSAEFTILPAGSEPLEDVRPFRGEWRAGEALAEMPVTVPFDAPDLGGASESIRALPHETDFDRTNDAAPTGAPPNGNFEKIQPTHRDRVAPPISTRFPLTVPRRE